MYSAEYFCLSAKQKQPQRSTTLYAVKIIYTRRNQEPVHARRRNNQHITHISTLESDLELNEGFIPLPMAKSH
jgi:hypothetical protein